MSTTIRRFPILLSAIPLIILALISCSPAPETLHHVVFDANGGSWAQGTEISLDVPDNAPIWNARPSVPERSGYSFRGWFSDKAATKPYDPDSLVTSDTVLYAGWTADRVFRITFDTEGGSSVAPQLVTEGHKAYPPVKIPERSGYAFIGWSAERGSSTLYDFSSSVSRDMTLYAVWKAAKEVAFAYDLPASLGKEAELSPCPQPEAVPEGSTISRPEATLSYNGTRFGFLGWFKEGSTEPFDFSSGITEDITLHARWEDHAIASDGGYIVYSEEGLRRWAEAAPSASCTLIADIQLAGQWTPIGTAESPYGASFIGNGHTISGMAISGESGHQGLFGYLGRSGSVKGLALSGISISGAESSGGIAGESQGTIEDCSVSGSISGSGIAEGGIAGRSSGTISGCTSSVSTDGDGDVGGIAGINTGRIERSSASGSIRGEYAVGGIAGLNMDGGTIEACTFSGRIADGYYAGGIAGCNDTGSTVTGCSFEGTISDMDWYIGGIAGLNSQESVIRECSSSGTITGNAETGGIVGYNFAAYVYACTFSGTLSSDTIGGGIAGISMGPLEACVSSGTVRCSSTAGGIAGINRYLEMKACYSTGITEGSNAAGAIAGLNERGATITACYWQGGSGLPGIGRLMQLGTIDVHEVAGDTTWESAMAAMNAALSGSGYGYELNTGNDAQPIIPVRR